MSDKIVKVRHAGVSVSIMERSLCFYEGFLGFSRQRRLRRQGEYISRLTGTDNADIDIAILTSLQGEFLELLCFSEKSSGEIHRRPLATPGRAHIAVTVDGLNALYFRGLELGVEFITPPIHSPDGVLVCFCRDPDGLLIELVEPLNTLQATTLSDCITTQA